MKNLYPLMFVILVASQALAVEPGVVVTDESIKEEAAAVYNELKKDGLTDAQIVAAVEEKLRNETTQEVIRSVCSKKNQKYIVWGLVGVLATVSVCFAGRWAYGKLTAEGKGANKNEPQKLDSGIELQEGVNKWLVQRGAESSHQDDLRICESKIN